MHVRMPMGEGCDINQLVRPYPPHTDTGLFKRGLRFGPSFAGRGERASDEYVSCSRSFHLARQINLACPCLPCPVLNQMCPRAPRRLYVRSHRAVGRSGTA